MPPNPSHLFIYPSQYAVQAAIRACLQMDPSATVRMSAGQVVLSGGVTNTFLHPANLMKQLVRQEREWLSLWFHPDIPLSYRVKVKAAVQLKETA